MKKNNESEITIKLILKVVPLAMGVAVITLAIIGELNLIDALFMAGIGVACLGVRAAAFARNRE